ncbi:hypothetical protein Tco_0610756 [Tanacetum coccineum]
MGDFNVALNIADSHSGLSQINSTMIEFKDCVSNIEVMDINCTGLHFTWNQKPRGGDGILKKLDRIMGNMEFIDSFLGAHAIFQPYRISDHSPVVLKIPSFTSLNLNLSSSSTLSLIKASFWKCWLIFGVEMWKVILCSRAELDDVQKALNLDPNNMILREEEAVYVEVFNLAKLDKERFLKQKAKIEWLDVGDSNSAYFHKMVKSKNQRSRNEVILNANNQEVSGPSVPDVFISHYDMFFSSNMACNDLNIDELFQNTVSGSAYLDMVRQVSDEEINNAMFDIGDYKAPSPDGFTLAFFKKGWDIVGPDVCKATREFFTNGRLLKEINHTFIARIPKILKCFGFHPNMIKWIMACVTSTSFSLSINGNIHGYFKGKWGLRQGDPLSPYLFTLVMEVLTLILKRKVSLSDSFRYHKHCEELQLINVCFADDLFIFAHGDVDSAQLIMEVLDEFKDTLGLVPSIPKSTVYFCNVVNHVKNSIHSIMPITEGKLPVKYLGVPLISSRLLNRDCKVLIEQVKNIIGDWKNKSLSFARRL